MSTTARVMHFPRCDFCGEEAHYDAKTVAGPWAFMCEPCWLRERQFPRLGTGEGQRLELASE